jgi:hypothetical protein
LDCETSRFPHFLDNHLTDGGEDEVTDKQMINRWMPGIRKRKMGGWANV